MKPYPKRSPIRRPTHPGELLRTIVIPATGKPKTDIARFLGVTRQTLSGILAGRHGVTPTMAVRLEALFGPSADSWMRMQLAHDVWRARQSVDVSRIPRIEEIRMIGDP